MSASFIALFVSMLVMASLFVVMPLWRSTTDAEQALVPPKRWAGVFLTVSLVVGAAALYRVVGNPDAMDHVAQAPSSESPGNGSDGTAPNDGKDTAETSVGQAQIEAMVSRLAQRLQTQPQDPQGWRMLAKSYETLGRFDQAVQAYQRLMVLQAPDADLLTDYAVTLGMSKGQTLAGEPEVAINQALKLDPKHIQALALSGSAAFEQRDYKRAVSQWQKILALIPQDADMRASIERNVQKAKALGG